MESEVKFPSGNIELAGTLTLPDGVPPFPGCLLVGGSGPQLRDGSFDFARTDYFPNPLRRRPLLELEANALAQAGVASLRYDKRGCGASKGDIRTASFDNLVSDASAAADYLHTVHQIDGHRIGILGQSEGAAVALSVACARSDLSFLVAQSCFFRPMPDMAEFQLQDMLSMPAEDLDQLKSVAPYIYWETMQYKTLLASALAGDATFVIGDSAWSLELGLDYYRQVAQLDPSRQLAEVAIPVLIVHGGSDSIVPAENAEVAAKVLRQSARPDTMVRILPGIEHGLHAADAPTQEVGGWKVVLPDQGAIQIVVSWVRDHVAASSQAAV